MHKQYHLDEYPPPSGFRIYFDRVSVMGITMRKADAAAFCKAQDRELALEREPGNPHDANAIKLIGSWKGWFGRKSRHLGYVPADMAAKLAETGLADTVRPRLMKTYLGTDGFVEIEFQVIGPKEHYERLRPPKPAPSKLRTPQEDAHEHEKALARLAALIAFLTKTPPLSPAQVEKLRKASSGKTVARMMESGETHGQASGAPAFLNLQEDDFRDHLQSIDNDLSAQLDIVDKACRLYFETGEVPAPYYPWRIAVILSKKKMKDRERDFLAGWCHHFALRIGGRYGELVKRVEKLGVKVGPT